TLPRLVTLLSWTWDDVEAPALPPGIAVEGHQVTAMRRIAAGGAHDDEVVHDQRRAADPAAELLRVFDVGAPELFPGQSVQRDDEVVLRAEVHVTLPERHGAVGRCHTAPRCRSLGPRASRLVEIAPEGTAGWR